MPTVSKNAFHTSQARNLREQHLESSLRWTCSQFWTLPLEQGWRLRLCEAAFYEMKSAFVCSTNWQDGIYLCVFVCESVCTRARMYRRFTNWNLRLCVAPGREEVVLQGAAATRAVEAKLWQKWASGKQKQKKKWAWEEEKMKRTLSQYSKYMGQNSSVR